MLDSPRNRRALSPITRWTIFHHPTWSIPMEYHQVRPTLSILENGPCHPWRLRLLSMGPAKFVRSSERLAGQKSRQRPFMYKTCTNVIRSWFFTFFLIQTIIQNLLFGTTIKEAIDRPRLHHQLFPMTLLYEKGFPQVKFYFNYEQHVIYKTFVFVNSR